MALAVAPADVDVVLCDLQMPGMDGVEFVRYLASLHYKGGVILVSGEDPRIVQTADKLARAHQLNVLGVLQKPVALAELKALLCAPVTPDRAPSPAPPHVYSRDDIARAIVDGDLINYYQPKVSTVTGAVAGVETLVRWQNPQHGLVLPDRFIDVAEEHGLIDDLTDLVLTNALQQARRWHSEGIVLQLAVNVSVRNLTTLDFPDRVIDALKLSSIAAETLILEVTESRVMKPSVVPLDILARLRLKHIGLSIDDFGIGHSSLAQLRDVPFDELKVDRSFVHGASRDPSRRAIIDGSLAIARQLSMRTVGEGVQAQEDWDFVRNHQFDYAQGYFIARPMPGHEIAGWIRGWQERLALLFAPAASA